MGAVMGGSWIVGASGEDEGAAILACGLLRR